MRGRTSLDLEMFSEVVLPQVQQAVAVDSMGGEIFTVHAKTFLEQPLADSCCAPRRRATPARRTTASGNAEETEEAEKFEQTEKPGDANFPSNSRTVPHRSERAAWQASKSQGATNRPN